MIEEEPKLEGREVGSMTCGGIYNYRPGQTLDAGKGLRVITRVVESGKYQGHGTFYFRPATWREIAQTHLYHAYRELRYLLFKR